MLIFFVSPLSMFLMEGLLESKSYFVKSESSQHLSEPGCLFWSPLANVRGIWDNAAFKAVWHCRRCGIAGGE